ncbi:Transmembrane protein 17A [Geodia barretti]|uniref:Transmembrane protein 17A n=1 Tax=Geodia barretti TaxID=519541 RepID=A0AA35T9Q5_GEOBA|nr:Transmembrane protein 17A [Geodia barretti]
MTSRARRVRFSDRVETFEDSRRRTSEVVRTTGLTPGAEVYTSLPLQMAVYFNVFYAPLWATGYILALQTKFSLLATHYRYVSVLVVVVMISVETARLYLAYEGNLREKWSGQVPCYVSGKSVGFLRVTTTCYGLASFNGPVETESKLNCSRAGRVLAPLSTPDLVSRLTLYYCQIH